VIFLDKIILENFSKKKKYIYILNKKKLKNRIKIYIYIYFIRAANWPRVLMYTRPTVGHVYINTRGQLAVRTNVHAANWPRVLKYTWPIVQLVLPRSTACMYVATYTRPTVRHVYSDRTRGEL
jgi:hypothetical protein